MLTRSKPKRSLNQLHLKMIRKSKHNNNKCIWEQMVGIKGKKEKFVFQPYIWTDSHGQFDIESTICMQFEMFEIGLQFLLNLKENAKIQKIYTYI